VNSLNFERGDLIYRLKLPIPPSVNHMYRNAIIKGRVIPVYTQAATHWKTETILLAAKWARRVNWRTAEGKVIVRIWYYFPDKRKRDTHNTLKALMDALEDARIYDNDQLALPHIMDYTVDRENPRIEIELEALH
jgi:crossover junction endodeoxyribonuclease RusA